MTITMYSHEAGLYGLHAVQYLLRSAGFGVSWNEGFVGPVLKLLPCVEPPVGQSLETSFRECLSDGGNGCGSLTGRRLLERAREADRLTERPDEVTLTSAELGAVAWLATCHAVTDGEPVSAADVCSLLIRRHGEMMPEAVSWISHFIRASLRDGKIRKTVRARWTEALHALESAAEERDIADSVNRAWEVEA